MVHYRVYRDEADLPISDRIKLLESERVVEERKHADAAARIAEIEAMLADLRKKSPTARPSREQNIGDAALVEPCRAPRIRRFSW